MNFFYVKGLLFLAVSVLISAVIMWHADKQYGHEDHKKMFFVCTTNIIGDAVSFIAGEYAHVHCLMGPGIDPHTYRAREGDVHRVAKADIIFSNGLHLEGRMHDMFDALIRTKQICVVTACLDRELLHEVSEGVYDPHVWHDLFLWRQCVQYIAHMIAQYDSVHADYFYERARIYDTDLERLSMYIDERIKEVPLSKRILVTAHDAFHYFAQRYNFSVIGLQGMSTDAEVTLHDISDAVDAIVRHRISTIFLESSISSRSIHAVKQAVNTFGMDVALGEELYSDSLGDQSSNAATYSSMLRHNVNAIVSGLITTHNV